MGSVEGWAEEDAPGIEGERDGAFVLVEADADAEADIFGFVFVFVYVCVCVSVLGGVESRCCWCCCGCNEGSFDIPVIRSIDNGRGEYTNRNKSQLFKIGTISRSHQNGERPQPNIAFPSVLEVRHRGRGSAAGS